jgi:hypothetical protein
LQGIHRLWQRSVVRKSRVFTPAVPIACVFLALAPTSCGVVNLQRPPAGLQKESLAERASPSVSVWIGADQESGTRYRLYADRAFPDAHAGPCTRASRAGTLRVIGALQTEEAAEDDDLARRLVTKGADLLVDYCADELGHYSGPVLVWLYAPGAIPLAYKPLVTATLAAGGEAGRATIREYARGKEVGAAPTTYIPIGSDQPTGTLYSVLDNTTRMAHDFGPGPCPVWAHAGMQVHVVGQVSAAADLTDDQLARRLIILAMDLLRGYCPAVRSNPLSRTITVSLCTASEHFEPPAEGSYHDSPRGCSVQAAVSLGLEPDPEQEKRFREGNFSYSNEPLRKQQEQKRLARLEEQQRQETAAEAERRRRTEEAKAEARRRWNEFKAAYGVTSAVSLTSLTVNPFAEQGNIVATHAQLQAMLTQSTGLFGSGSNLVSIADIPPSVTAKLSGGRPLCLAFRVLGKTEITGPMPGSMMVPSGRYVAIHFCEGPGCADINSCSD